MSHSLEWRCPSCRAIDVVELTGSNPGDENEGTAHSGGAVRGAPDDLHCSHCDHRQSFPPDARASDGAWTEPLARCLACGTQRLFVQKDFNRKMGVAIVIVGAVLSPWTYGASLVICMLIDYGLYYLVPEITVCYGCDAIHRGFSHNPAHKAHDPMLAEHFRREAQEEIAGGELSGGDEESGSEGAAQEVD